MLLQSSELYRVYFDWIIRTKHIVSVMVQYWLDLIFDDCTQTFRRTSKREILGQIERVDTFSENIPDFVWLRQNSSNGDDLCIQRTRNTIFATFEDVHALCLRKH